MYTLGWAAKARAMTRSYYILCSVSALTIFVSGPGVCQEETQSAQLRITLSKRKYSLDEPVVVTYRLTNLSSSMVCFPPPAIDCYSISGELAATATPPKGVSGPKFGGGCAADRWGNGDVGFDIDQHWIKLGPLQSYEVTQRARFIGLIAPGRWMVEAGYVPMRGDTLSEYQGALKERGCSILPELHLPRISLSVGAPVN